MKNTRKVFEYHFTYFWLEGHLKESFAKGFININERNCSGSICIALLIVVKQKVESYANNWEADKTLSLNYLKTSLERV